METFFARYRNALILALVLIAQFILLAVQVRPHLPGAAMADQAGVRALRLGVSTVVTPPESALHKGGLSFRNFWSSYVDLVDVKERNEQLEAEKEQLELEQAALAEDARQGERLRALLAFKEHYIDTTVPAQVVGASGSDHERLLSLDKGSDDGIAVDMPVITPDGIVGRIRDAAPHASQVLEISDPTSATGVLLEDTRIRGILRGDTVGRPEIVNIMPDDRIKPGQLVLTSGGDQIFPRGLPVGVVDKVVPDADNLPLVDVVLKPAANLNRLEEVLVITGTATAPTERDRRDLAKSEGAAAAIKAAAAEKAAEAAEAALEAQRASDILAQRLPSASNVENPDAPDAAPGASPATADSAAAPLHPPGSLHADQYTPGGAPKAESLTPGARRAALAEGVPETERTGKGEAGNAAILPSLAVSPAFRAAHEAAMDARQETNARAASPGKAPHEAGETAGAGSSAHRAAPAGLTGGSRAPSAIKPVPPMGAAGQTQSAMRTPKVLPGTAAPANTAAPRPAPFSQGRVSPSAGAATAAPGGPVAAHKAQVQNSPSTSTNTRSTSASAGTSAKRTVTTRIVDDGPLPSAAAQKAQGRLPSTPNESGKKQSPPRRTGPEIVPDDGSRPPAQPQEPR